MRTPLASFRIIRPLLLGTLIAVVLAFVIFASSSPFYFEVTIKSSLSSAAQVYYDIGHGIREADSVRRPITGGNAALRYRFPLPNGTYRGLRFDPSDLGGAAITIRNALIVDRGGHVLRKFRPVQFRPAQQISRFDVQKDGLLVATAAGGTDPILSIDVNDRFTLKESPIIAVAHAARRFLVCLLTVAGIGLLASIVAIQLRPLVTGWSLAAANWARRSPRKALLLIAVASVVMSCYPVVFFGKSFVSPNIVRSYMLYPAIPTLPGYQNRRTEDTKGSDTGATLWQNLPYSFIESRALFGDRQLPLWDRWNSAGTTLFGQGLSMLGDPLHLLVLAFGGAAWAWDIKFLIAKVLFCWGIGLTVFFTVKHLSSAMLVTFSSAFIGFFYHRFDHPAFFSMCYAPWILYAWLRLAHAASNGSEAVWAAGLVVVTWLELNSGTVKEAYMLLITMHTSGFLVFLFSSSCNKTRKSIHVLFAGIATIQLTAPVWLSFLHSLGESFTAYDVPHAWQIQPSLSLGLFDDIFYRTQSSRGTILSPSANFFVLLGVLFGMANIRTFLHDRTWCVISLSALTAYMVVFGILPPAFITRIPFVGNVGHIDNVFSSVLIIYCLILAGFGFRRYCEPITRQWKLNWIVVATGFVALLALFLGFAQAEQKPPVAFKPVGFPGAHNYFVPTYIVMLFISALALPWLLKLPRATSARAAVLNVLAVICLLALHWRFGLHLNTNINAIDDYVINPQVRVNLTCRSSTVEFLRNRPPAFRTAGLVDTLFPGYNAIAGLEAIYGVDPLINPFYRQLLTATGVTLGWTWRWVVERTNFNSALPVYSLLNVRYFLDAWDGSASPPLPLNLVQSFDLKIYENPNYWPRAFFSSSITSYGSVADFVAMVRSGDGKPFAAVQQVDRGALSQPPVEPTAMVKRNIVPARDYLLTNNTTSFTIDAPGRGVVVLTEAFLAGDFVARINGARAKYFRVNHAFRGIEVPGPGIYHISYSYWPRYFTSSLIMGGLGLLEFSVWLAVSFGLTKVPSPAQISRGE